MRGKFVFNFFNLIRYNSLCPWRLIITLSSEKLHDEYFESSYVDIISCSGHYDTCLWLTCWYHPSRSHLLVIPLLRRTFSRIRSSAPEQEHHACRNVYLTVMFRRRSNNAMDSRECFLITQLKRDLLIRDH